MDGRPGKSPCGRVEEGLMRRDMINEGPEKYLTLSKGSSIQFTGE